MTITVSKQAFAIYIMFAACNSAVEVVSVEAKGNFIWRFDNVFTIYMPLCKDLKMNILEILSLHLDSRRKTKVPVEGK